MSIMTYHQADICTYMEKHVYDQKQDSHLYYSINLGSVVGCTCTLKYCTQSFIVCLITTLRLCAYFTQIPCMYGGVGLIMMWYKWNTACKNSSLNISSIYICSNNSILFSLFDRTFVHQRSMGEGGQDNNKIRKN